MAYKLIKKGNTKLGKDILTFSLPPGDTCPGKSAFCKSCYAVKYYRQYTNCRSSYETNYNESLSDTFSTTISAELTKANKSGGVMRIHPSGDFYSAAYIDKWADIAKANTNIMFYGYTRSYTVPEILPSLEKLKALDNVVLFASTDDTMDVSSIPADWRIAYAGETKPSNRYVTCLEQAGKVDTCFDCKICFKKLKSNVHFIPH